MSNFSQILQKEKTKQSEFEEKLLVQWSDIQSYLHTLFETSEFDVDVVSRQTIEELRKRGFNVSDETMNTRIKKFILTAFIHFKDTPPPPRAPPPRAPPPRAPPPRAPPPRAQTKDENYRHHIGLLEMYLRKHPRINLMDIDLSFLAQNVEQEMYDNIPPSEINKPGEEERNAKRKDLTSDFRLYKQQSQQQGSPQQQEPIGIHSMGFDEKLVRRALSEANGNEEIALDILLRHQERPQGSPQGSDERGIIYTMGFNEELVQRALSEANGNEEMAIEILLGKQQPRERRSEQQQQQPREERQIYSMGFDEELVRRALEIYNNDEEAAIDALIYGHVHYEDKKLIDSIKRMPTIKVDGNGNCLFLSLIGSLQNLFIHINRMDDYSKVPVDEARMRKYIVDSERQLHDKPIFFHSTAVTLNAKPSNIQPLIITDPVRLNGEENSYSTVKRYFELMETDGAYGTEVEIMTAARIFGVTIFVQIVQGIQGNTFARYNSSNPEVSDSRAIYIIKSDMWGHYDWKNPYSKQGGGKHKQGRKSKITRSKIFYKMNKSDKNNKCKKLSKRETRYKKILYKYSSPSQAQKMATKYLSKTAKLYPANNPVKKYRICDPVSKKWVNFGQLGYEDYTRHKDKTRRHNYLTRSAGMSGNWKKNKYSANNLSRRVLW